MSSDSYDSGSYDSDSSDPSNWIDDEPTFPLQSLPILAQVEVAKSMSAAEALCLAQASKKFRSHMKTHYKLPVRLRVSDHFSTKKFEFNFLEDFKNTVKILIEESSNHTKTAERWKFGNQKVWTNTYVSVNGGYDYTFMTYWKENGGLTGFKNIIDFFKDSFEIRYLAYNSFNNDPSKSYQVLDYILSQGLKINFIMWGSIRHVDSVVEKVLTAGINVEELDFQMQKAHTYLFHGFHDYSLKTLVVQGAHWLTVENLCSLVNCAKIELQGARFTSQDLNVFLKHFLKNPGKVVSWSSDWKTFFLDQITFKYDSRVVMDRVACERTGEHTWIIRPESGVKYEFECQDGRFMLNARPDSE